MSPNTTFSMDKLALAHAIFKLGEELRLRVVVGDGQERKRVCNPYTGKSEKSEVAQVFGSFYRTIWGLGIETTTGGRFGRRVIAIPPSYYALAPFLYEEPGGGEFGALALLHKLEGLGQEA